MSQSLRSRPSELLLGSGQVANDPYTAYCLDEAVTIWGQYVEGQLDAARDGAKNPNQAKNKVKLRFQTLMADHEEREVEKGGEASEEFPAHLPRRAAPSKFRDPMDMLRKKG